MDPHEIGRFYTILVKESSISNMKEVRVLWCTLENLKILSSHFNLRDSRLITSMLAVQLWCYVLKLLAYIASHKTTGTCEIVGHPFEIWGTMWDQSYKLHHLKAPFSKTPTSLFDCLTLIINQPKSSNEPIKSRKNSFHGGEFYSFYLKSE